MAARWDIFCSVVDNYGDIGVTWRLARQLQSEHGLAVRLWCDDLRAFARLCPALDVTQARQWLEGVEVCRWGNDWQACRPAEVVIEAFACTLPEDYVAAMAACATPPLWLNLEYLSAEDWIDGCHGLPSPQPHGLRKFFFFPGFSAASGGLVRERELLDARDRLSPAAFLDGLVGPLRPDALRLSLFCYANPALAGWLDALAEGEPAVELLVPEGRALNAVAAWAGEPLAVGSQYARGALRVIGLPFLSQPDYDRLLWGCDLNLVRGEDSFVRAQWAARPLLWHIYVQEQGVHLDKLDAFLARYLADLPASVAQAVAVLQRAWNGDGEIRQAWRAALPELPAWRAHAVRWSEALAQQADLARQLVTFAAGQADRA